MKLDNRQKLLLGICGVGLVVLVFDQFRGPASAEASSSSNPATASAKADIKKALDGVNSGDVTAISARLDQLAFQASGASDPMRTAQWLMPRVPKAENTQSKIGASSNRTLKLSAILRDGDGGIAIVNGKTMRVGDAVEGSRLEKVAANAVLFSDNGGEFIVRLKSK